MGKGKPRWPRRHGSRYKPSKKQLEASIKNQEPRGSTFRVNTKLFTDEYKVGDKVCIIRYEHGWLDGRVSGVIMKLDAQSCLVHGNDGLPYNIDKPRDICHC